jgi:hypothetical protein
MFKCLRDRTYNLIAKTGASMEQERVRMEPIQSSEIIITDVPGSKITARI